MTFIPPDCHYIYEEASHRVLANIENLITSVWKSIGIVQTDYPPSHHALLGTKWHEKSSKTLPVRERVRAVYKNWITSEIFTGPYGVEKLFSKKSAISVDDLAASVRNKLYLLKMSLLSNILWIDILRRS